METKMTKKRSRHLIVRKVRRALNRTLDGPMKVSGRRLNRHGWGAGITKRELVGHGQED